MGPACKAGRWKELLRGLTGAAPSRSPSQTLADLHGRAPPAGRAPSSPSQQPLLPQGPDAGGEAPSLSLHLYLLPRVKSTSSSSDPPRCSSPRHYVHQVLASAPLSPPPLRLPPLLRSERLPLNSGEALADLRAAPLNTSAIGGRRSWGPRIRARRAGGGASRSPSGLCRTPQGVAACGPLELPLRGLAAGGGAAARALPRSMATTSSWSPAVKQGSDVRSPGYHAHAGSRTCKGPRGDESMLSLRRNWSICCVKVQDKLHDGI